MNNILKTKDKNLQELIKGSGSAFAIKVIGMVATYTAMLLITRLYGAEQWGLYSIGVTFLNIAILIPVFGFDNSLVRIISELTLSGNKKNIINVVLKAIGFTISLCLITIVLIKLFLNQSIVELFNQEELKPTIKWVIIAITPFALLKIFGAVFQSFKRTIEFMLFKSTLLSVVFLSMLGVFYWLKIETSVFSIYLLASSVSFFIGIVMLLILLNKTQMGLSDKAKEITYKNLIKISSPMLLASSFALLMGWSDILMLTYFGTTVEVGIYNSVIKLASLTLISLEAINSIATPKFAESYSKKDMIGLKNTVKKSTRLIFFTSTPILLVLILFPKPILSILGEEFIAGYIALTLLCAARFINSVSGSVGFLMQMTDNQRKYQNVMLTALFLNVILNFILIPKYGINGAATASAFSMIFWNVTLVILIKRKFGFWTFYIPFSGK